MCTKVTGASASNDIFRKLGSVFLVSSVGFTKASPTQQTATMSQTGGLPVVFVESFYELQNSNKIREKLLNGDDVSIELEFNNIELSDEDRRALLLVKPVLEKICKIGPAYPWLPPILIPADITVSEHSIGRGGYTVQLSLAEKLWKKASKAWAKDGTFRAPGEDYIATSSGHRYAHISKGGISVGCQSLKRAEFEAIARQLNWAPEIAAPVASSRKR
jgi:hypothetical protein